MNPDGQIFIGLATHQTTGIGMHIFSHLIPTIERENIDLQDPYISIWNEQLLISIGKIIRFIYDQTILDAVNQITEQSKSTDQLNQILSPYAFQESSPNKEIGLTTILMKTIFVNCFSCLGRILVDGFFSSDKDILVPVKRSPSDNHLSLIPSSEAFLTNSKHIEKFLPVPLVPFEIGKNDFFKILKRRQWIEEIDHEIILNKIHESILLVDQFVELLRWLSTNEFQNKSYIKQILSKIHFRQSEKGDIIKLNEIIYYDTFNLSSLPLPTNVLPSNIVSHLSRQDLQKRLSLSQISIKTLIEFYLNENEHYLLCQENTSIIILNFICQHWNQLNSTELNEIKNILSNIKCISTTQGMKSPNESYIQSTNLSPDLPIITFYIPQISTNHQTQYPISIEFLKSIGCRTIHVPTLANTTSNTSSDNSQTFIQHLLLQRQNMSENDIRALKHNHCITGQISFFVYIFYLIMYSRNNIRI